MATELEEVVVDADRRDAEQVTPIVAIVRSYGSAARHTAWRATGRGSVRTAPVPAACAMVTGLAFRTAFERNIQIGRRHGDLRQAGGEKMDRKASAPSSGVIPSSRLTRRVSCSSGAPPCGPPSPRHAMCPS